MNRIEDDDQNDRPLDDADKRPEHEPAQVERDRRRDQHPNPTRLLNLLLHSNPPAQLCHFQEAVSSVAKRYSLVSTFAIVGPPL